MFYPTSCRNVSRDFSAKIPMVLFTVPGSAEGEPSFPCELSLNNHSAFQTSALLRDYFSLDPRVATLSAAVRLWAMLCRVDRQAEGTLPAHAFAVMLVYYLQQETKPVLPCLHDHLEEDADTYQSKNRIGRFLECFVTISSSISPFPFLSCFPFFKLFSVYPLFPASWLHGYSFSSPRSLGGPPTLEDEERPELCRAPGRVLRVLRARIQGGGLHRQRTQKWRVIQGMMGLNLLLPELERNSKKSNRTLILEIPTHLEIRYFCFKILCEMPKFL